MDITNFSFIQILRKGIHILTRVTQKLTKALEKLTRDHYKTHFTSFLR
ncbi:MAG: hypothetical protein G01um101433_730 [Parcubacteria group bacterium Gr01-1014_33]|nr:MAG: hypothetical protein G01um101433_730 [Parcubacteria group bacterium Gr01-1014_33]